MVLKKLQKEHQYEFSYVIETVNPPVCELEILELPSRLNASVNDINTSLSNILYINASFEIR